MYIKYVRIIMYRYTYTYKAANITLEGYVLLCSAGCVLFYFLYLLYEYYYIIHNTYILYI